MFKFKSFKDRINKIIPKNSRVTLNRKQIFILPTKFGLLYLLVCFILLVMAINFENSLVYILLFWLISIFISTMILTWKNLDGVHLRGGGNASIFAGDDATFNITIESLKRSYYGLWLSTKDSSSVVDCPAITNVLTHLFVQDTQRGRIKLPRFTIETTYPLGIFRAWSYVDLDQSTLCYPKPIYTSLNLTSHDEDKEHDFTDYKIIKERGVDNFDELKNYVMGDSIARIDWRAYAKGHGLLVKSFSKQASKEIWINEQDFVGDLETRLSYMCYWVLELSKEQQRFGFILGNIKLDADIGETHTQKCLEALALYGKA